MDCPICETSNIPESNKCCPTCGYDVSPYPLVLGQIPAAFIEKEQQRIAWAKKLWADSQAKIAQSKAASTQYRDQFNQQFNQIVSQVEQLTQVQIQLSNQLAELVSASISTNMSARFSEIEQELEQRLKQELEQRLEDIATSRLTDLSTTIELKIIDKLKESLSEEISTAVSQLEQRLDSLVAVCPQLKSTTPQPSAPDIVIPLQTLSFTTVKVNNGGDIVNREDHQAEYFTEGLGNGVTLEMVYIPGGTFTMGSPESEKERNTNEGPQHQVTVPAFFMGKYLVTQQQWQAVMGDNPSNFKGVRRPVENVSWNYAVEFCQRLSQRTGRDYRLPSEAEWEYACRAGTTTPFYFGETITTNLANYSGTQTTDVEIFPPNAFGLYDMHGNVWEWCADYWYNNYSGAPTDGSVWISRGDSNNRLLRGGGWVNLPRFCRSGCRYYFSPGNRDYHFGFRIVVSLPRTP